MPIVVGVILVHLVFRYLGWFTYYANLYGFGFIIVVIFATRPDLIKEGVIGGLLLTIITLPVYWIVFNMIPGWREAYWNYETISGYHLIQIPYEDIIWWFFAGAIISVVYDYFYGLGMKKDL